MERAGRAVVFSGTTVGIGLLSLVVLPVPFLASIGPNRSPPGCR
jgi:putative drug exporter of the RND superfamily